MTISHQSETLAAASTSSGNYDTTVTPAAAPNGVCVIVIVGSTNDLVTSASYGGIALTRLRWDTESTEAGGVFIYWGADAFGAGAQTARIVRTGTVNMRATWFTMTVDAGNTLAVDTSNTGSSNSMANPSWDMTTTTAATQCYLGIHSGLQTMTTTPATNWTLSFSDELANIGRGWARRAASSATNQLPGWTAATADDFVGSSVAFKEVVVPPPVGVNAVMAEVAVQAAQTQPLFGTLASQKLDPVTGGVLGVTVDTTVTGQAADLYYEESGSPTTVPVDASTTHTETIDAPDMPATNYLAIYPDPEP